MRANSPDIVESENMMEKQVTKRDGTVEVLDVDKIFKSIEALSVGLDEVDPRRVAEKTIEGLSGMKSISTREVNYVSIHSAAHSISEEPQYNVLAVRLLLRRMEKEAGSHGVVNIIDSIRVGYENGLINQRIYDFSKKHEAALLAMVDDSRNELFDYLGLSTLYGRYLLKHPTTRYVTELPQHMFMRIAIALARDIDEVAPFYDILSNLDYLTSSPTLFNAGSLHEQLSSCFLLDSPKDSLSSIFKRKGQVAQLSKYSGGIGFAYHRVRSLGSYIKGTNGHSNGIVPFLKVLDETVAAVNQGGRRKGACAVYLEPWHADIEAFLELRDNTGPQQLRVHSMFLALWIPDLFMKRLRDPEEEGGMWSLFDPQDVPHFPDLFGEAFEEAYIRAEKAGLAKRQIPARVLYRRMMQTIAETGNGWLTFKDRSNKTCNQTTDDLIRDPERAVENRVVHLSNLCTEIIEVSSDKETAVCNLGSINLENHTYEDAEGNLHVDYEKIARTVTVAVRRLDRVIDINFYPTKRARRSNMKWRPVGLGMMGLHGLCQKLRVSFASPEGREISRRVAEEIYYNALKTSVQLAKEYGRHETFELTRAAKGELQFDYWDTKPVDMERWDRLREEIKEHGLRNSLLCAIAPTATIAGIAGCSECIEPRVTNLFKRETMTGEFISLNKYLVEDLKKLGLWTEETRQHLLIERGSVQRLPGLDPKYKEIYLTAWEMSMRPIIEMAAERGAFIDQSQSLNLFMREPEIGKLSSMYWFAWHSGLKTTYYLRSRPATDIAITTVSQEQQANLARKRICSLENPGYCEACQ